MDKAQKLIRELRRECGSQGITRSDFDRIVAPYLAKPAKRLPAKRAEPRKRKTVVRLRGAEMAELRQKVFLRDDGKCLDCHRMLTLYGTIYADTRMELSHIKSRGAGGSDTLENCVTRCRKCHQKSHAYGPSGKKPCPAKRL